jgi:hypothetical protein
MSPAAAYTGKVTLPNPYHRPPLTGRELSIDPGSMTPPSAASMVKAARVSADPATATGILNALASPKAAAVSAAAHANTSTVRARPGLSALFQGAAPVNIMAGRTVPRPKIIRAASAAEPG